MQIVKTRQGLSIVWSAMMLMLLAAFASPQAEAQLPSSVFSATTSTVGLTDKVYPTADGAAAAYRVAVNSRGDTFWENYNYSGATQTLVEVPAGTTTQIAILINVKYNSGNPYIDSKNNLWLPENNGNLAFVPFVNGTYASNLDDSSATVVPVCTLPMTTVTTPCHFTKMDTAAYGYYVQAADMTIDASGDIWLIDRSAGTLLRILEVVAGTTSTAPVTNTVINSLPYNGTPGNIAIASNGDIYYVDRTNFYYGTVATAALNVVTGYFKNATGVSLDSAGNLYVTDTGNSRIAVVANVGGTRTLANNYTFANVLADGGVGLDPAGNITYSTGGGTSAYTTSIVKMTVGYRNLGAVAVAASTAATELDLYFPLPATFGSFTLVGGSGATNPFSIASTTCTKATAYATNAECVVMLKYTASTPGPQYGALLAYDNSNNFLGSARLVGTGTGALIDVDPGTVTAVGTTWTKPDSIAVDAAGNTYVADNTTGGIYKNGATTAIVTGFNAPTAVAVDGADNLYVADTGNNRIMKVPYLNSAYGTPVSILTGLVGPSGLTLDASGNLYVADSGNARVLLLSTAPGLQIGTLTAIVGSGYTTPVSVAVDNSGNIYVSDAGAKTVSEYVPSSGTKTTIISGLTTAAGIALDPGGSLFVVDAGKLTITRVPNIAGVLTPNSSTVLSQIVATPVALAIDTSGNVYAADSVDATVGKMARTIGSLAFGPIVQGVQSQALTALVSNAGTSGLTFANPYYIATGSTTAFALQPATTCANSGTVAAGSTCSISATFTPPAVASYSETLTFASNAAASTLVLTGTGVVLVTDTITGPTTLVYGYGTTVYALTASKDGTYNLNVTGSATATIPVTITNGIGSFTLPKLGVGSYTLALAGAVGTASLTVTPATLTLTAASATRPYGVANPVFTATAVGAVNGDSFILSGSSVAGLTTPVGQYNNIIPSASGSGLSNYNVVLVNGTLTITAGTSTTGLTITSSNAFVQGGTVTFTAVVSAKLPSVGTPTGTVTFQNVTVPGAYTTIGTATVTGGVATFATTALPAGTIDVLATYSGDMNFAGSSTSTYTAITITLPSFTLQISQGQGALVSVLPMTIIQGQTGSATLTVTPIGPFTSPVTFYCYNLPIEASCSFFNSTLTPNGGPVTGTLVISTKSRANASNRLPANPFSKTGGAALLALMVGTFAGWRRKRRLLQSICAFLLVSLAVLVPLSGCGLSETPDVTPLGVSQVTVTGISASTATQQSVTIRLAITSQ